MVAQLVQVHLGAAEYGTELMRSVASEIFAARPDVEFVRVFEHGGWFLSWHRDGTIVGTANDRAALPRDEKYLRPREIVEIIRR